MLPSFIAITATVALVALIDFIPRAIIKVKRPIELKKSRSRVPNYLIMPTVYGDIAYLKNISYLKKHRKNVVICTSKYETKEFYSALRKVCKQYGFRYIRAELPKVHGTPVKNAYTIYAGAFKKLGNLKVTKNTPCILIDADTYSEGNTNDLVRTFIATNLHIASLRCEVAKPKTVLQILQAFEYKLAMDNRSMDSWLTSGACNIATAGVYQHVFNNHSSFFAGGDIEIGKIAAVMGYRVGHIGFTFLTEAPATFSDWYSQRLIWFAGGFRHHVANIGSFGWYHFFMLFYNSAVIYLLLPLRWIEVINYPATLILMLLISWTYTFVLVAGRSWRKEYLLLPFYSLFQTMWVIPRAFFKYLALCWSHRSFGILSYDLSKKSKRTRLAFTSLNLASAGLVIAFVATFSAMRINYWMHNPNGYLTKAVNSIVAKN
jgi:hypothetical protein